MTSPRVSSVMEIPHVDPLGLVHRPDGYEVAARRYPVGLRLLAAMVVGVFVGVTVLSTAYSLGSYCLTTWGGHPLGYF